ncbi:MAG TPA: hypothetical protein VFP84_06880 [Kofleriaceae bacterium]|nr:hypothetical protein [Kofleriaceae bacterium]
MTLVVRMLNLRFSAALSLLTLSAAACTDAPTADDAESATTQGVAAMGTLHLAVERKIADIIALPSGASAFEASGVQLQNGQLWIVFDNMTKIAKINENLASGSFASGGSVTSSQYEAITFDSNNTEHFYVAVEQANEQVVQYDSVASGASASTQSTNVTLNNQNKDFEGLAWVFRNNNDFLLGLCEGFSCTANHGGTGGTGQIIVMAQNSGSWTSVQTLNLPSAVQFKDYSDIGLFPNGDGSYKVAVTSQESKALWIGTLSATSWAFLDDGTIYPMPSSAYCNIEGVTWLNASQLAVVSDQNNSSDTTCDLKDQMIHYFNL